MEIASGRACTLAAGEAATDDRREQRNGRYQTEPLMSLEHVRPFVESGLLQGICLRLIRREAQIPQRRRLRIGGGRLCLILGISLRTIRRERRGIEVRGFSLRRGTQNRKRR